MENLIDVYEEAQDNANTYYMGDVGRSVNRDILVVHAVDTWTLADWLGVDKTYRVVSCRDCAIPCRILCTSFQFNQLSGWVRPLCNPSFVYLAPGVALIDRSFLLCVRSPPAVLGIAHTHMYYAYMRSPGESLSQLALRILVTAGGAVVVGGSVD